MMSTLSISRCLRRLAPGVLILVILVAAAACGPLRRRAGPQPAALIFTNQSLDQASVYIVGSGVDFRRLGTVFAGQTDTLSVPAHLAVRGPLNIVARLLARSDVPQTGPVLIRPGAQYQVKLPLNSRLISFLPAGS
jgi:hypothetical protein